MCLIVDEQLCLNFYVIYLQKKKCVTYFTESKIPSYSPIHQPTDRGQRVSSNKGIGVNLKKFKVDDATAFLVNVQTT